MGNLHIRLCSDSGGGWNFTGINGGGCPGCSFHGLRHSFITRSMVLLVSTLIAFLAAGVLVAFRLRRPVAELQRGMQAVANGNLDVTIDVQSRDEFQVLAESFAALRDELRPAAVVRQSFQSFVMRSLDGSSRSPIDQRLAAGPQLRFLSAGASFSVA